MATIQSQIDQLAGTGASATNLTLSAVGAVNMAAGKKNVKITTNGKDNPRELLVASTNKGLGFAAEATGLNSVIMYAEVKEEARVFEHPLEDGTIIADHEIQQPVEIKLQIVMPYYFYNGIIEELRGLKERGELVAVHTQGGVYTDMVYTQIPHTERAENVGRISFECSLKQAVLVKGESVEIELKDVKQAQNSSTQKSGVKQGKKVDISILADIEDSRKRLADEFKETIKGLFSGVAGGAK